MKKTFKKLVVSVLGWQIRRLYKKHEFQVVAVAGSVGKTSTKLAIANVLKVKYRVQYQEGNYNDLVSVPLIFFGQKLPSLVNPFAWFAIFWHNEVLIHKPYPFDVIVVELGTDAPGQINQFKKYLKADIAVLTAITPEHMEYFKSLEDVAIEELSVANLSTNLIFNNDTCEEKYTKNVHSSMISYGIKQKADFQAININFRDDKCDFEVQRGGQPFLKTTNELISEPQLYSVTAAVSVGSQLGLIPEEIDKGLHNIHPVSGRMQRLAGINGSLIIDDTYNASPEAVKAALETLYRLESPHKIAILGNMNELGKYSEELHRGIGMLCDPKQLELLVTIGKDANSFLAPEAHARGCNVKTFESPYQIGNFLKDQIKPGALILAKGSQNGVFAEEAVKILLAQPSDSEKLVRQSTEWLKVKQKAFNP